MSLAGLVDVLTAANHVLDEARYEPVLLGVKSHQVQGAGGLTVQTVSLEDAPPLEAAFVVSDHPVAAMTDPRASPAQALLMAWLVAQAAAGRVLGGIGTGAAWLAEAGLMRGHRITVHWPHIAALSQRHADLVVSHRLFEIDGARLSCAGHQASRDLMLAWLAQRHGAPLATELAALMGMERLRTADERQRVPLAARMAAQAGGGSARLAEALTLMEANLAEPLPTEEIARLAGVSRRQLERLFKQHLDALPSRWYLELRLQRARRLLRQTSQSVLQIGLSCGFASGPHFSNAYRAQFGHTPRDERNPRLQVWAAETATMAAPAPAVVAPDAGHVLLTPARKEDPS